MDWTAAFAVIGALALVVSAAVAISTVSVLAWIGAKYVWGVYRDDQKQVQAVDAIARDWEREQRGGWRGGERR